MNEYKSRHINSSQLVPHKNLAKLVNRYQRSSIQDTIPKHAYDTFAIANNFIANSDVILDSGCGTGESSYRLARQFPNIKILGIDKSSARLQRTYIHGETPDNLLFVRADCIHFWRLIKQAHWNIQRHYLFYPNPWPKPGHLQRRWHAHPVFPVLISLGGVLIMRTNWGIYAQEFAQALEIILQQRINIQELQIDEAFTPFERKYMASNHCLFEIMQDLT